MFPQFVTLATGFTEADVQKLANGFTLTVGGFFTITVLVVNTEPHEFVAVSLML